MAGYVLGSSLGHNSAIDATNLRMYTLEQRMLENRADIKNDYDAKISEMIEQSKSTAKEMRLLQEDYINLTATVQAHYKTEVKH